MLVVLNGDILDFGQNYTLGSIGRKRQQRKEIRKELPFLYVVLAGVEHRGQM